MKEIFYGLHWSYLLWFSIWMFYMGRFWTRYGFKMGIWDLLTFKDPFNVCIVFWGVIVFCTASLICFVIT